MLLQESLSSFLQRLHCSSTHHYFALDALPLVQTPGGKRLVRVLLRHHERYLRGATDPDTRFRDYQNHVIHVKDGYWGGAPRMAHKWYDRMQRYLRTNRFSDAAHAAGVLSHYFTDSFQPLHTEHSELERVLHRPIEYSIYHAYSDIYRLWRDSQMEVVFQLSDQVSWLGESMLHGSRYANRKFRFLLHEYDLLSAVDNPRNGFNEEAKNSLAELFGLAITGWAKVLDRAAHEAESDRKKKIPIHWVAPSMLSATWRAPLGLLRQCLGSRRERKQIMSMIDEYATQGQLVSEVPAEIDIVHRVAAIYRAEKEWRPPQFRSDTKVAVYVMDRSSQSQRELTWEAPESAVEFPELSARDSIFKVAFIGGDVAQRMVELGVERLDDFLEASLGELAERMKLEGVTAETLAVWQSQLTLMVSIKGLGELAASWLVAAGYTTAESIALGQRSSIHQAVRQAVATHRSKADPNGGPDWGQYPRSSEINTWIALATAHVEFAQRRSA